MIFVTAFVFAQNNSNPAIKIYLEDAYNGKNICDAKVTLEGFEIPAITGKYDKVGKFYYFTEIPEGYNTVMAYHKKYNEKGFQNIEGLPKEIKLKLYTPYRVRIPGDSLNYYKEDNSKIVIMMNDTLYNSNVKSNEFCTSTYTCFVKKYFKEHYQDLIVNFKTGPIFTFIDFSFYVTKKNKKSFKRFNDVVINKLETDKNILFLMGLLLETKIDKPQYKLKKEYFIEDGTPNYIPKQIKYVNYDTLYHQTSKSAPKLPNYEIANIDKKGKVIKSKKIKILKKTYSDMYLSYKDKYKRGLLKNDIYPLNNKELDSLYKVDEKKIKKGLLYDFEPYQSIDTLVNYRKHFTNDISESFPKNYPNIVISNVLKFNSYRLDFMPNIKPNESLLYEQSIKYENKNLIDHFKLFDEIIMQTNIKSKAKLYKLKNNLASPLGIIDLIEYNNNKYNLHIYQNINQLKIDDYTR